MLRWFVCIVTLLSMLFLGIAEASLVLKEDFETDQLNENVWGIVGEGVGGPNSGKISNVQAFSGSRSWWIGSMNGIFHILVPALKTATVYCRYYDNEKEARVNAQVMGCTSQTDKIAQWPIAAGDWMYIGTCTTGPNCAAYYYRSKEDGEVCVGNKRVTGWHPFAFVIDGGNLEVYVDGEKMEECNMSQLGAFVIFHHWSSNEFQKEGGFVDDVYIFSAKMDPGKDPSLAVVYRDKIGITWGKVKTAYSF